MGFEKIIALSCVCTPGDKRLMLHVSVFVSMLTLRSASVSECKHRALGGASPLLCGAGLYT